VPAVAGGCAVGVAGAPAAVGIAGAWAAAGVAGAAAAEGVAPGVAVVTWPGVAEPTLASDASDSMNGSVAAAPPPTQPIKVIV
jgi:hypothetical protein